MSNQIFWATLTIFNLYVADSRLASGAYSIGYVSLALAGYCLYLARPVFVIKEESK